MLKRSSTHYTKTDENVIILTSPLMIRKDLRGVRDVVFNATFNNISFISLKMLKGTDNTATRIKRTK